MEWRRLCEEVEEGQEEAPLRPRCDSDDSFFPPLSEHGWSCPQNQSLRQVIELDLQKECNQKPKIKITETFTYHLNICFPNYCFFSVCKQFICVLPVLAWFVDMLLLRFGGSALIVLGGLTPEPTELAVLFTLCGGTGAGPLRAVGARGSIALGFPSLDSTEKV